MNLTAKSINSGKGNSRDCTVNGINYLDLIGEKAAGKDFAQAQAFIEMNYGVEYPKEKLSILFDLIREENWSAERLKATVKWFLKTKKYPNWTVADWFEYGEKLYPYSWYQEQVNNGVRDEDLQGYRVNGKVWWKLKDNTELPFEKI
jgi:hypothetical protein